MCDPIIRISGYMPTLAATTDLLHLFGDPTRVRLLALLARHELTVAELTAIMELAQSRVSTHLGKLREAGPAARSSQRRLHALRAERRRDAARGRRAVDAAPGTGRGRGARIRRRRAARRCCAPATRAAAGPTRSPARWSATTRRDAPGRRRRARSSAWCSSATCSTAARATARSRSSSRRARAAITCLDRSPRVLAAARARLARVPNVRYLLGELEAIPVARRALRSRAPASTSSRRRAQPARVIAEAARVLRAGGGLTLVTLDAHQHGDVTARYGHVAAGLQPPR